MQLRYSATSPYVRKVVIAAAELGLDDKIERVTTDPWSPETDLRKSNPLSKIPCLITDEGNAIYDSPVICEYLNTIANGTLYPTETEARFKTLTLAAAADGLLDAGVLLVVERMRRPEELRWDWWIERQITNIRSAFAVLEEAADDLITEGPITIAEVGVAATLDWIQLRHPDLDWAADFPKLKAWYDKTAARPSFKASAPPQS